MDETPALAGFDQPGLRQRLEVKRKCGIRQPQGSGDAPHSQPIWPLLHEQAKDGQAGFLRQGGKLGDCKALFHLSNNMEIISKGKLPHSPCFGDEASNHPAALIAPWGAAHYTLESGAEGTFGFIAKPGGYAG